MTTIHRLELIEGEVPEVRPADDNKLVAEPSPPSTPGHVAKVDPMDAAEYARKRLRGYAKELLVKWCREKGLYRPKMDRERMIDALARAGFAPPSHNTVQL